jgi:DNA repair exonuclease SbcCD nuclease subunit
MKILCIGDQHFQTNNVGDVECFMSELESHLEENEYDLIVSMGDLLHTHERIHTLSLNRATEYFKLLVKYSETYVIVGNHDMINASQFLTNNHWLNSFKEWDRLTVVDDLKKLSTDEGDLIFLPFVPDGRFLEALNRMEGWTDAKIIFGHQTINGAKMGAMLADNCDDWDSDYPLCISGHIHDPQKVGENFVYVGSAFQLSFNENEKKRLLKVDLDDGEVTLEDVRLKLNTRYHVKIHIDNIETFNPENYDGSVKLSIECSEDEFKGFKKTSKYAELIKAKIKINPIINSVLEKEDFKYNNVDKKSFIGILDEVVKSENNMRLDKLYREIVYGTENEEEMIIDFE